MPHKKEHLHKPTAHEKAMFKKHWKSSGKTKKQAAHSFKHGKFTVGQFASVHKHKKH